MKEETRKWVVKHWMLVIFPILFVWLATGSLVLHSFFKHFMHETIAGLLMFVIILATIPIGAHYWHKYVTGEIKNGF